MRLLFAVILGVFLFLGHAFAQEDNVATATTALQDVLTTLKQSVQKLSLDNDQLVTRNHGMKSQVLQLQMQLGRLEAQGDALNKESNKLQGINPGRARRIMDLEEESLEGDHRNQKVEEAIKSIQQSLDTGYQEDQRLVLRLKGVQGILSSAQSPESQAETHRQKEKLKLMKMINDSQQRQEELHQSILDFQKSMPLLPAATALAHQQFLKEQIQGLENQIAAYPHEKPAAHTGLINHWDDAQLGQLESELRSLERNYSQLKGLMEQMIKKAHLARMTVSQHVEEGKLQSGFDDLNHQAIKLRNDLDDLRSQLVDLDKRKSHLETMIPR